MQEQDRRMFITMILIAMLYFVYITYFGPKPEEFQNSQQAEAEMAVADSLARNDQSAAAATGGEAAANSTDALVTDSLGVSRKGLFLQNSTAASDVTIENELVKLTISTQGGIVKKAELKNYYTHDSLAVLLLDGDQNEFTYEFFMGGKQISTQDYIFEAIDKTADGVNMRLKLDDNSYIEQSYSLAAENGYLLDYDLSFVGLADQFPKRRNSVIDLHWKTDMIAQEKSLKNERYTTGVYYREWKDDVNYLSETSDDREKVDLNVEWVSFKQQFFNSTLLTKDEGAFRFAEMSITQPEDEKDRSVLETAQAHIGMEFKPSNAHVIPMQWYFGPNKYDELKALDHRMEKMVPLGWGIFGWVNKFMIIPMFNFLSKYIGNYGVIILIITLVIKLALFPLTRRSYMSFAKMNVLKPELEELKAKHEKDPQRLQQEQMKLYGQAGVNPMGGCLPQLIQLPILIAMYRFFPASIELRQQPFLWADDLSTFDSIMNLPFSIPFYGDHVSLFCLLGAAAQFGYIQLNNQMTPTSGGNDALQQQMRSIQYLMPFMLLFFFNSFAAALTFYFFLSTIISFVQQYVIKNYSIDEEKLKAQIAENKKKPRKQSKFQQRLEQMMKEQQAAAAAQQAQRSNKGKGSGSGGSGGSSKGKKGKKTRRK